MQTSHTLFSPDRSLVMCFTDGDLRKIRLDRKEILQRVYFAVRDKAWLNVPYILTDLETRNTGNGMQCSFEMWFKNGQTDFQATLSYTVTNQSVVIEAKGRANADFWKNRIGFCLHIPVTAKGAECKVTHPDDTITEGVLPIHIAPHQPFKNIRSIHWSTVSESIDITFSGDEFEMEDQRNWTDASYKIYSTPLDLPFPVKVKKDELFSQKIILSATKRDPSLNQQSQDQAEAEGVKLSWPLIGFTDKMFTSLTGSLSNQEINQAITHCRINLLLRGTWKDDLAEKYLKLKELSLPLLTVLYFSDDYRTEVIDLVEHLRCSYPDAPFYSFVLLSVNSYVLPGEALNDLSSYIRDHIKGAVTGGGTDANFAQLNRNRPNPENLDFLCYSIQPQEHASDQLSIVENIQGQADTVKTALTFSKDKEIHISTLTFYRKFNANLHYIAPDGIVDRYTFQGSVLECGWFIGSLYQLIKAGVKSVTLECILTDQSPFADFFRFISQNKPEYFDDHGNTEPEKYACLAWGSKGRVCAAFVNLTGRQLTVQHPLLEKELRAGQIVYVIR